VLNGVVDTGPFIHLHEIGQLACLPHVIDSVHLPQQVEREINNTTIKEFIWQRSEVTIHQVSETDIFSAKDAAPGYRLHLADLAVLALLKSIPDAIAATDDLELRKAVENDARTAIGTVGLLVRGYRLGYLGKDVLFQLMDTLFNDSTLYLSSAFKSRVKSIIEKA
jgi:predicted nucleic acid-binding protein